MTCTQNKSPKRKHKHYFNTLHYAHQLNCHFNRFNSSQNLYRRQYSIQSDSSEIETVLHRYHCSQITFAKSLSAVVCPPAVTDRTRAFPVYTCCCFGVTSTTSRMSNLSIKISQTIRERRTTVRWMHFNADWLIDWSLIGAISLKYR